MNYALSVSGGAHCLTANGVPALLGLRVLWSDDQWGQFINGVIKSSLVNGDLEVLDQSNFNRLIDTLLSHNSSSFDKYAGQLHREFGLAWPLIYATRKPSTERTLVGIDATHKGSDGHYYRLTKVPLTDNCCLENVDIWTGCDWDECSTMSLVDCGPMTFTPL